MDLVSWALEEGFDLAGVAPLGPAANRDALRQWLERGDHAGMEYMARRVEVRGDPCLLLPGARSALCVALRYGPPSEEPEGDLWPRVARYARGRDYHDVLGEKLERLEARIAAEQPGARTRRYVDTGPILERDLAAAAGLGWIGKNTMLIHPREGSYFVLGEILTTLELGVDIGPGPEPIADLCGSCTRCLEACPTGALSVDEPYRLDSRRCISYWTIEHRGDFPEGVGSALHGWVFGCDVCQEVCPWNRKPAPVGRSAFEVPPGRRELDLDGLAALDRADYVRLFKGSPMKRAKLEGLRRNAEAARISPSSTEQAGGEA
jgi:epoxyqueuosine reductase